MLNIYQLILEDFLHTHACFVIWVSLIILTSHTIFHTHHWFPTYHCFWNFLLFFFNLPVNAWHGKPARVRTHIALLIWVRYSELLQRANMTELKYLCSRVWVPEERHWLGDTCKLHKILPWEKPGKVSSCCFFKEFSSLIGCVSNLFWGLWGWSFCYSRWAWITWFGSHVLHNPMISDFSASLLSVSW